MDALSLELKEEPANCNMFAPAGSGKNAYLMPGPDSNGLTFQAWLNGNPSTIWNYYDVGIALYRLYYRTGNSAFQNQARQFADIHWQWMLDHLATTIHFRAPHRW